MILASYPTFISDLRTKNDMSRSLLRRFLRSVLYFKLIAVVLVTALVSPGLYLGSFSGTRVAAANVANVPVVSAPPEPFILANSSESFANLNTSSWLAVLSSNERLNAAFGSVLGFLAPKKNILRSEQPMPVTAGGSVEFDFDNDGKADVGRWRASNTQFEIKNSGGGANSTWTLGTSTAKSAPADYDGDGKTDAAVFDNGTWTVRKSSTGTTQTINSFGALGDIPVSGNYVGTSEADAAVYRPSNQTWYVREAVSGTVTSYAFGNSGDVAVPGNYDGDSLMDFAVFRPSTGIWYVYGTTSGAFNYAWGGAAGDVPVAGDYDGDGKTDYAIFRPVSGKWFAHKSSAVGQYFTWTWGNASDQPAPADYDGDGKADVAVWRPTSATWYILRSSDSNYETHVLGAAGDVAVPSAYFKQIGAPVAPYPLAQARLSPKNATGGTDLYSRNFSWGTSLVSLLGRAGMNAGFGMSYNSLVWTKEGSNIHFDADYSNISPGFRFGFPTIEPSYYDEKTTRFAYLMVTPSGARLEFRQTAASDTYEAADSSYVQLKTKAPTQPGDPAEDIDIVVTGTDGTQMTYDWKGGAFRCTNIKDRNGNYISIAHDDDGLLRTVTDTLGRVITVNYDSQLYPISITQTWKDNNGAGSNVTHTWASFSYTTQQITTNFSDLTVIGPTNGTVLKVLEKVIYADGSHTKFTHNGYGQVWKVQNYAADNHELNRVRTNLETPGTPQTDCPRFTETRSWVENFNQDAQGVPQETVVTNSVTTGQTYSLPGGLSVTATKIEVSLAGHPHAAVSKTFVGESGWMEGLPIATEDWADGTSSFDRQRWTWNAWTQDDENLSYTLNPRVLETRVGDSTNTKRTTVEYYTVPLTNESVYGLVREVKVYDTDLSTVLKRAYTEYNLDAAYTDRRIVGLPFLTEVYGKNDQTQSLEFVSKMTYAYDEGNFSQEPNQIIAPTRHDTAGYGSSFIVGRGNLTSTTRHDVTGQTSPVTSRVRYDIAGSPVAQISPWDGISTRTVRIGYADNFNSSPGVSTYAYPTVVTDPAGTSLGQTAHSSFVKYRYDIGANVEANSPAPEGNQYGKKTTRTFDSVGRLQKESVWKEVSGIHQEFAYTRYQYFDNKIQSKIFTTVIDTNSNGVGDVADEVESESWSDGAGRVRRSRKPHTFDSNGDTLSWAGAIMEYDVLGRTKRQSVPTEINSSWNPTGDDYRGMNGNDYIWLWKSQEYDWMSRVTREINTDGTDTLAEYDGCGCAGSLVVTLKGEQLTEGRRTQKIYSDILGRQIKIEMLDWAGNVYKTATNSYNGRDQVVSSRVYAGLDTSSEFKETTSTFDGHGRLHSQHVPQQDANTATVYTYFADDKPQTITDARGATKHYLYNNVGMIGQMGWTVPQSSGIEIPATVTFGYDGAGNRAQMNDGLGSVTYEYDELSRITAENRQFNETVSLAPQPNNSFQISYTYDLLGQLKTLTEPFGEIVSFGYDRAGRLIMVSGNRVNESIQLDYVTNAKYRSWGALKRLDHGNTMYAEVDYNNRLQAKDYNLTNNTTILNYQAYQYHNDGRLKFSSPSANSNFDRSYEYDFLGRLTFAKTGAEARGQVESNPANRPYRNSFEYNQFGNTVGQNRSNWVASFVATFQYQNGRIINESVDRNVPGWEDQQTGIDYSFDKDGRRTEDGKVYDAEGRLFAFDQEDDSGELRWYKQNISYDAINNSIKSIRLGTAYCGPTSQNPIPYPCGSIERKNFRIYSSVVGEDVTEVDIDKETQFSNNAVLYSYHRQTYIRGGGQEIAERRVRYIGTNFTTDKTLLKVTDSSGVDRTEIQLRNDGTGNNFYPENVTLDTFGASVGYNNPYPPPRQSGPPSPNDPDCTFHDYDEWVCIYPDDYEDPDSEEAQVGSIPQNTCYVNGFEEECSEALRNVDPDTPVTKEKEFPDLAPSDNAPQGIHQNDDPTDNDNGNAGEKEFEQQYTAAGDVSFDEGAGVSVDVTATAIGTVSDWDLRGETMPRPEPTPPANEKKDCDLSSIFGDVGSYFFDNTASKDDPIMGKRPGNEHSHLYGSSTDSSVKTGVYAPKGGGLVSPNTRIPSGIPGSRFLGSSRSTYEYNGKTYVEHNANYVLVQYDQLGKLSNVTLAIYHIDNFAPAVQPDGRLRLGTIGFSGAENYGSGGSIGKNGGHSHIELLKGKKWNLQNKKLLNLRDICP